MKREEKNALSRQRILDAAMDEFSRGGYGGASMNAVCSDNGISKGIVYHYFRDRDELYLLCVEKCFDAATEYLGEAAKGLSGTVEEKLGAYFDARLRFFAGNRPCAGIFAEAVFSPPEKLAAEIAKLRRGFDALNVSVLVGLLDGAPMRSGLAVETVARDFGMYMDYFNVHFGTSAFAERPAEETLRDHEEMCRRQINILLYGVLERINE